MFNNWERIFFWIVAFNEARKSYLWNEKFSCQHSMIWKIDHWVSAHIIHLVTIAQFDPTWTGEQNIKFNFALINKTSEIRRIAYDLRPFVSQYEIPGMQFRHYSGPFNRWYHCEWGRNICINISTHPILPIQLKIEIEYVSNGNKFNGSVYSHLSTYNYRNNCKHHL